MPILGKEGSNVQSLLEAKLPDARSDWLAWKGGRGQGGRGAARAGRREERQSCSRRGRRGPGAAGAGLRRGPEHRDPPPAAGEHGRGERDAVAGEISAPPVSDRDPESRSCAFRGGRDGSPARPPGLAAAWHGTREGARLPLPPRPVPRPGPPAWLLGAPQAPSLGESWTLLHRHPESSHPPGQGSTFSRARGTPRSW